MARYRVWSPLFCTVTCGAATTPKHCKVACDFGVAAAGACKVACAPAVGLGEGAVEACMVACAFIDLRA